MNYFAIYDRLIDRAKTRDSSTLEYIERHHIIPRCMGGSDDTDNLVALSLEEHFVAHQLLTKMFPSVDALAYAANMMGNRSNKHYGWLKRQFVEREKVAKTGKKRSPESVAKQVATLKKQYAEDRVHNRLGSTISEKHRQRISESNRGKDIPVESRCSLEGYTMRYGEEEGERLYKENNKKKDSKSLEYMISKHGEELGKAKYEEWRLYLKSRTGEAHPMFGRTHSEETKAKWRRPKERTTCPHCGKEGGVGIMKRWHFDNCKNLT